ncbi:MAG: mannose-1-phosphate guanylyltransferase [Treponema sp.]|jgi:mannose-1-phosphate guanylyltransferase/mannose-1-phosphate guanylyltransferase/mannose-6-phosphate isomerase|nr:mannose-1-phosphate guanylyltransferase [Treponema sp.]
MFSDCIIMAGGSGTRLWPASNSRTPKQFLPLRGGDSPEQRTFFNAALDRALAVTEPRGRVIIIAGRSHTASIVKACAGYPGAALDRVVLIPEPCARNTAPAIACAVSYIDWMGGEERNILVLTSDHIITPLEAFQIDAAAALAFAQADRLVIFGITPKGPETGFGYIEAGTLVSSAAEQPAVYQVKAFREKPGSAAARAFLQAGNFFWNSGMFAFSSKFILREFERSAGEVIAPFGRLRAPGERSFKVERGLRILEDWYCLDEAYREAKAISFDYAIAEKCSQTVMVSAGFNWTDVGSWDEYALLGENVDGKNGARGPAEIFQIGASNCYVDSDISVALIDVEDLIVAVRSGENGRAGAVLVAKRGETQKVREIVERIKAAGRTDLL